MYKKLVLLLLLFSPYCMAERLTGPIKISRVFSEGTSTGGFYSEEGFPQCKWGVMYIDLGNETGKAQFSILLAAKVSNSSITRIDYDIDGSGICKIKGLHF